MKRLVIYFIVAVLLFVVFLIYKSPFVTRDQFNKLYPNGITAVRPFGNIKTIDYYFYNMGYYHYDIKKYSDLPFTKDMQILKLYEDTRDGYIFTATLKLNKTQAENIYNACLHNKNYTVFGGDNKGNMIFYSQGVFGLEDQFDRIGYSTGDIGCYWSNPNKKHGVSFSELNKTKGEFSIFYNESPNK